MTDARAVMRAAMSEDELQTAIVEAAQRHGWLVHHDRPMRSEKGWRTGVQGDAGFPDLVLARAGVTLIIECKSERGRFEPGQEAWIEASRAWVVKPRDLDTVIAVLSVGVAPELADELAALSRLRSG